MKTSYFLKCCTSLIFFILVCRMTGLQAQTLTSENQVIADLNALGEGALKSPCVIPWNLLTYPGAAASGIGIPSSMEELSAKHPSLKRGGLLFTMRASGSGSFMPADIVIVGKNERIAKPSVISIEPFEPFQTINGEYWHFRTVALLPIGSEITFTDNFVNFYGIWFSKGKILIEEQGILVTPGTVVRTAVQSSNQASQGETRKLSVSNLGNSGFVITDNARSNTPVENKKENPVKQADAASAAMTDEQQQGQTFLEENKKRPEVQTTASGLQYEVVTTGTGIKPGPTSKVKVHYHGTLLNGDVFDSSVVRGKPIELKVNQVIQGWQEALQLMPAGSKWKIYVPHQLAYGEKGAGTKIKPFSTLIFDIELLEVFK